MMKSFNKINSIMKALAMPLAIAGTIVLFAAVII